MSFLYLTIQIALSFALASTGDVNVLSKRMDPSESLCEDLLNGFHSLRNPLPSRASERIGCVNKTISIDNQSLWTAYTNAIFPWGSDGKAGIWCTPDERGVLDFNDFHIPGGDQKVLRRLGRRYRVTVDQNFAAVIDGCAGMRRVHRDEDGREVLDAAWISPSIRQGYAAFARAGHAHSIEVWEGALLVGGLYYADVLGVVTGESIFSIPGHPSAGKLALATLIEQEIAKGRKFIDTQQYREEGLLYRWGASAKKRVDYVRDYLLPAQAAYAASLPTQAN